MRHSESLASFAAAFCKAQAQMTAAKKDAENPFFKSKYADLQSIVSVIRPCLTANGLSYSQPLVNSDGEEAGVETIIMHESGEWLMSDPVFIPVSKADAHGYGSAQTYARRYSLASMCGLETADDDANAAVAAKPVPTEEDLELALKLSTIQSMPELEAWWGKLDKAQRKRLQVSKDKRKSQLVEAVTA